MNIPISIGAVLLLAVTMVALPAEEGNPNLKVQGWDFSDRELVTAKGEPCADLMVYLTGAEERYKLLGITGIPGPPGVVYTLQNNKGDYAIIKCGVAGGGGGCEE